MVTSGDDQLRPMLDPSNVIVLDQVVGDIFDSDTPCASFQMVLMAPRSELAISYCLTSLTHNQGRRKQK